MTATASRRWNICSSPFEPRRSIPSLTGWICVSAARRRRLRFAPAASSCACRFLQLTYVEVNGKHLYFNLADGQVREVVGSMKEYEDALLTRPEFMRIHRSYIVNMLQIEELSPAGLRTFSGRELPVSRLLYPQLQKDYMKLLFAQREE